MRYPQAFMDALKSHFLVSEVVGKRVQLRRHGREFLGLCPFHKEKTPSFTVNDEKGFYHCFGCGAHGDTIGFIKEFEGISYKDAVERLASDAGVSVPQPSREEVAKERLRRSLQEVMEMACRWFEGELHSGQGYRAQSYIQERGLAPETVGRFRIGYAPDDRDALKRALLAEGVTEEQMIATGLLIRVEGRPTYSRFRGRLMFPIRDKVSKVVAFGGRILPGMGHSDAPKYLNSPETDLFKKGGMLYNFDLARKPAFDTGTILVCEGYMDVIALSQVGLQSAVAPLGTAITASQLQLLWQVCDTPALCLDGDTAGERAMFRVAELALPLLAPGKSLSFVMLPKGEDPDTLVKQQGVEAMNELVTAAPGLADVLWDRVTYKGAKTPEARAGQEQQLLHLADQIQNPTVKGHYRSYFKQKLWEQQRFGMTAGSVKMPQAQAQTLPLLPQAKDNNSRIYRSVLKATQLVLLYPQLLHDAYAEEIYARMEFQDATLSRLQQEVLRALCETPDMTRVDLHASLQRGGYMDYVLELLNQRSVWPSGFMQDADAQLLPEARRMWRQAVNAYSLAAVMFEFKQAEADMAADMSETALARFLELKSQLHAIEQERDQLYNEEVFEDT